MLSASLPQGCFAVGVTRLDGQCSVTARVHGKHLSLGFALADLKVAPVVAVTEGGSRGVIFKDVLTWLYVHLGVHDP